MIDVVRFDDYRQQLSSFFASAKLVPFLGSGFTAEERAGANRVPSGQRMRQMMLAQIQNVKPDLEIEKLDGLRFSQVADYFWHLVPRDQICRILRDNFVSVKLQGPKKEFLALRWPYLYTLNVDDAVEKNSHYAPVLPYKRLSAMIRELTCVYKLHGDALAEITYENERSIIFSKGQYLLSLKDNAPLLNLLKTDYAQNNMLFIGCSLEDEDDLREVYEEIAQRGSQLAERLYVTSRELSQVELVGLEIMGITKVVCVDD